MQQWRTLDKSTVALTTIRLWRSRGSSLGTGGITPIIHVRQSPPETVFLRTTARQRWRLPYAAWIWERTHHVASPKDTDISVYRRHTVLSRSPKLIVFALFADRIAIISQGDRGYDLRETDFSGHWRVDFWYLNWSPVLTISSDEPFFLRYEQFYLKYPLFR